MKGAHMSPHQQSLTEHFKGIFVLQIIEKDINPYVDEWEEACSFPAHDVFKKLGDAGFLGVNKATGLVIFTFWLVADSLSL